MLSVGTMRGDASGTIPDDREEFEAFARQWLPNLRRFIVMQLGKDREACEEVQQEVLVALYEGRGSFRGDAAVTTYLYRLARNKASDYLRKEHRRRRLFIELDDAMAGPSGTAPEDLSESAVREDQRERLWQEVERLSEAERSLLFLREIEGLSEKECAAILRVPVGTVKSRVSRIKKALYQRLGEGEDACTGKEKKRAPMSYGIESREAAVCETSSTKGERG